MAANEKKLGDLHEKVADVLAQALNGHEVDTGEVDDDGKPIKYRMAPSAAIIAAATKFLKDNDITVVPSQDNALGRLKEAQEARAEARKARRSDLTAASEQMGFLEGLPKH